MTTSEHITEIAKALTAAQAVMGAAVRDSANPFFKAKYADLASVWDACRKPLTDNGLAVVQSPAVEGQIVSVATMLTHVSGQWMCGTVSATAKDESPQAVGSAITYLRRYALQSFVGVAPEDDDGEAAQGRRPAGAEQGASLTRGGDAPRPTLSRPQRVIEPIDKEERNILISTAHGKGWAEADLRAFLQRRHGADSINGIAKASFLKVLADIEKGPNQTLDFTKGKP